MEGTLVCRVIRTTSIGVVTAMASIENSGAIKIGWGRASPGGVSPKLPVTAAAIAPAVSAGMIGDSLVPNILWLSTKAASAVPTMAGSVPSAVNMRQTNGATTPAIRPMTTGAGIREVAQPVTPAAPRIITMAPATIEAPTISGNSRSPATEAKRMSARTWPVQISGTR